MDPHVYLTLKTVHILSSTVLFGTGIGTAFHFWWANRSGRVPAIAAAARSTVIADALFTAPAVVIQPATGIALALSAGLPLATPWMAWAFVLYGIAAACWIPVVFIQVRLRDMANACERDGTDLPPEYHRQFRIWFVLGWPAFIALVAVFWLMVAKPT